VAIIRQGKIIAAGDMEEIVQGQTLEEAFLEADSDEE
jgi:ABC-2 type transport system ATP-binding protein